MEMTSDFLQNMLNDAQLQELSAAKTTTSPNEANVVHFEVAPLEVEGHKEGVNMLREIHGFHVPGVQYPQQQQQQISPPQQQQQHKKPFVKILEQPASNKLRFR